MATGNQPPDEKNYEYFVHYLTSRHGSETSTKDSSDSVIRDFFIFGDVSSIVPLVMQFRRATRADVIEIIRMLADDELGSERENFTEPLPDSYYTAFERIDKDLSQELIVVVDSSEVIGTLQLSFIQYLTYQGGVRAQIEAVRIKRNRRGQRLGERMFRWAIDRAQERGAHLLQLTTDKKRPDAINFYEKLGFIATHEGMKLHF